VGFVHNDAWASVAAPEIF